MEKPPKCADYFIYLKPLLLLSVLFNGVLCYNIEVNKHGISHGPAGSQFGYTVAIIRRPGWTLQPMDAFHDKELIVGAPNLTYNNIKGHGQISGCLNPKSENISCNWLNVTDITNVCEWLRSQPSMTHCAEDGRLGATVAVNRRYPDVRSDSSLPMITVCSPGWKNVLPESNPNKYQNYMIGMCLKLRENLKVLPCNRDKKESCWPFWPSDYDKTNTQSGRPVYIYAQSGLAATHTQDGRSEVISAPGAWDWRGAFRATQKDVRVKMAIAEEKTIYFGYAIVTGRFGENGENTASGIPNWNADGYGHYGQVILYADAVLFAKINYGIPSICSDHPSTDMNELDNIMQLGSKFGAALAAVDLTNDGFDELLVGAPLFTGDYPEEGRVFVYTTAVQKHATYRQICGPIGILSGGANRPDLKGKSAFGRFGTAIASVGDLDFDGYKDVAIGAPYEDDGKGAIYIYPGIGQCACKMKDIFSQRIAGIEFDTGIRSFGWSIYGDEDIDDNGYPDIVVGAYESNTVVMLRSRPIIDVHIEITMQPDPIPLNGSLLSCSEDREKLCFEIDVVIQYRALGDRDIPGIMLAWKLDSDTVHKEKDGWSRVGFRDYDGNGTINEIILFGANNKTSMHYIVDVKGYRGKPEPKDAWTKVRMEGSYEIIPTSGDNHNLLDPIIYKDAKRDIVEYIEFDKKCDSTTCTSDLKLSVEMFLLKDGVNPTKVTNDTEIYIDAANILQITTDVTNLLNSSYRANLTGEVNALSKRDASSNYGLVGASCLQSSASKINTTLSCTADSKLDRNENMNIKMYFDISRQRLIPDMNMDKMKEFIHVNFSANQVNKDVNEDNNVFERKIGVKLKYEIRIEEDKAQSDQVRYKADSASDRMITLTHRYYIINEGPSFLPKTYVNITVPLSKAGVELAIIKNMPEKCVVRGESPQIQTTPKPTTPSTPRHSTIPETEIERKRREAVHSSNAQAVTADQPAETSNNINITCADYKCVTIECAIVNLEKTKDNKQEFIDITIDVYEKELAKEKDKREVRYSTNATVTDPVVWYGGKVVPWDKTVYAEKWTTFVVEPTSVVKEVNIWIIIGSVLGALALLIIVILILWRCGFFARKKHNKVQEWKRASLYNRKSMVSNENRQTYSPMDEKENNT